MEEVFKEIGGFQGIVSDISASKIDQTKFVADCVNARFSRIGKNNYAWSQNNGDVLKYQMPVTPIQEPGIKYQQLTFYPFDNRLFAPEQKHVLNQKKNASTDYFYRYRIEIVSYNKQFTAVYPFFEKIHINFYHKVRYNASENFTLIELFAEYRLDSSATFTNTITSTINVSQSQEQKLIDFLQFYRDVFSAVAGSYPGYPLENATIDIASNGVVIYVNNPFNITIVSYSHNSVESETSFITNRFGFGKGSKYGGLQYPSAPSFPIPGSDFVNNPFAEDQPYGITRALKNAKKYYVNNGSVLYNNGSTVVEFSPTLSNKSFVYDAGADSANPNSYYHFKNKAQLIEVNPIGFGYAIINQKFEEVSKKNSGIYEIVHIAELSDSEALIFGYCDGNSILIYHNILKNEIITVLETTENLDFTEKSVLIDVIRYDNENECNVFWSSRKGHLRFVNVFNPPIDDFDFNTRVFKPCSFGNVFIQNTFRSGGGLLCGSYSFCFSLSVDGINYSRAGQITDPVMIGSGYYGIQSLVGTGETRISSSPKPIEDSDTSYRGAPSGTLTTESIEIGFSNIDKRYNFIKVYSVEYISGSSFPVVRVIYSKRLTPTEKEYLSVLYSGKKDVIEDNLPLSTVTIRRKVPYDVQFLTQISNRLIIANFKDTFYLREEQYKNQILSMPTTQMIGCDTGTEDETPGHKSIINQIWFKSLNYANADKYAWVFIDEYGNESEPMDSFSLTPKFYNRSHFQFDVAKKHIQGDVDVNRFIEYDSVKGLSNQEAIYMTPDLTIPILDNHKVKGGFNLNSFGLNIAITNPIFPKWATRAILVRKKEQIRNKKEIAQGFGILRDGYIDMCYIPEIEGYNKFENISFKRGFQVRILGISKTTESKNWYWVNPTAYCFMNPYVKVNHEKYVYPVTNFFYNQIPPKNERAFLSYEASAVPSDTILMVALKIMANIDYSELQSIPLVASPDKSVRIVHFQLENETTSTEEAEKEEYESTGYQIDLRFKYNPEYERFFIGDYYNATNHQIVPLGAGVFLETYLGMTGLWNDYVNIKALMPAVTFPLLTRFNMAMADDSAFPFLRMNGVIKNHNAQGFKELNRDYAVKNDANIYIWLNQEKYPVRDVLSNVFIFSSPRVIGSEKETYSVFSENHQIEVMSDLGPITAIYEFESALLVLQEKGCRTIPFQAKEFIQTSTGSIVTVGGTSFVSGNVSLKSKTAGSRYPGIKTEKGVYFYDDQNFVLYLATEQQLIPHSHSAGYSEIIKTYAPDVNSANYNAGNGLCFFYNKQEKVVCLLVLKRAQAVGITQTDTNLFAITDLNFDVNFSDLVLFAIAGTSYYGQVSFISINGNIKTISLINKISVLGNICEDNHIYRVNTTEPVVFAINEETQSLEYRSTKANFNSFIGGTFSSVINKGIINSNGFPGLSISTNGESVMTNLGQLTNKDNWLTRSGFVIEDSFPLLISKKSAFYATSLVPATGTVALTKKQFLFVKNTRYTITFLIDFYGGGGPNRGYFLIMPLREIAVLKTNLNANQWDALLAKETTTYSFIANETFYSPLCIYVDNIGQNQLNITNKLHFEIPSINTEHLMNYELEVYAHNEGEIVSLDNLQVNGFNLEKFDETIIYSNMQKATVVFDSSFKGTSKRVNSIMSAIPKLNSSERLRSNWFKIKFVYKTNRLAVIENITTFMRTLYGK